MPLRLRWQALEHEGDEFLAGPRSERRIPAPLEADRRARLAAHRASTGGAGEVRRIDLEVVGQPHELPEQAVVELLRGPAPDLVPALVQVRASCVADEERVAGEQEPRLLGTDAVA